MTIAITIPANKRQAVGKIYLDDLLWGTQVSGPALLNLNSLEFAWLDNPHLKEGYVPVLALFATKDNLDTFDFRSWCEDNYLRFENANDLDGFENAQRDIYYNTLDEIIIYQEVELSIDVELIRQNWAEDMYKLDGL